MLQTIHKLYIEPYTEPYTATVQNPTQRAFRTLHSNRSKPYTASVRETIHEAERKPCILFWTRNKRMERMNANESSVTNVTNVKQEMTIGGEQLFPHPTPFFGFNTSCFWRWKVLYLYRDMGGASAPPFFRHFPFKNRNLEAHPVKICLPLIFLCLPQILIRGRQSKTARRIGKIGRRKVFPKVKNVNIKSLKKRSKLLVFGSGSLPPTPP